MKVSVNWLRDYLPIELPANELAEKISRTTVEIEGQYQPQANMKNIVIAKVLSVVPHPDSDHMVITQVDAGEDEPIQIVTGAPNVAEGQTVILAKHNSIVGGGQKIKKGKLRGEVSNGMLTALQLLHVMKSTGKKLSELAAEMTVYPQKLVNVKVQDKKAALENEAIKQVIAEVEAEMGDNGRVLVRPSGTQDLLRVMAEAQTEELVGEYVDRIVAVVRKEVGVD